MVLNGQLCHTFDYGSDTETVVRDWNMQREADAESFSGRAHYERFDTTGQTGACTEIRDPRYPATVGDLRILDFRREK